MLRFIIPILCLLLVACGSSQKKKCESANWYQRGYNIAKQGAFPDGDFYFKRCEKEGADINHQQLDVGFKKGREEICDPKVAKEYGLEGKRYNFPICINYNESQMLGAYKSGLKTYCQPSNAYKCGAEGKSYENVCESNNEQFVTEYRRGRKSYITKGLNDESTKLAQIESKIKKMKKRREELKSKLDGKRMFEDERARALEEYHQLGFDINNTISEKNTCEERLANLKNELSKH